MALPGGAFFTQIWPWSRVGIVITSPDNVQFCLFYSYAIGLILSVLGTVMLFIGGLGSFAGAFSLV